MLWTDSDGKEHRCRKYDFISGIDKRLHNTQAVVRAGHVIEITEGQLDADALEFCGLHAVGVPGASAWRPHHRRLFVGFERVRIWGDGDRAGREFAKKVGSDLRNSESVTLPEGQDPCAILAERGMGAILALAEGELMPDPVPPTEEFPF
ncbi:MAG: hypothetical protein ACRCSN_19780 [Dermatophilaceae bacterium]